MAQTLYITDVDFVASEGKLDANYLYIHRVSSAGEFVFSIGKTLKLTTRGFVYDVGDRHIYLNTDDSSFAADFIEMTHK